MGSINLAEFACDTGFDFDSFKHCVKESTIALNEVLDEGLPLHPLKEQRESVYDWRQIGLGIFGLADLLIKLGIKYGSPEAIDLCDMIGHTMADTAIKTSAMLAKENGVYPKYKPEAVEQSAFYSKNALGETKELVESFGLRNSQLLTIAPTGSLEKYHLNRLCWSCIADNPAIRGYRNFIKEHGGRECAYHRQICKLMDGKLHDNVEFEILAEEFRK